jgi:hypothetical protein
MGLLTQQEGTMEIRNVALTDEHVAAYERLERARMHLARLGATNKASLPLKERAALELAYDLAIRETAEARTAWDRLVEKAGESRP